MPLPSRDAHVDPLVRPLVLCADSELLDDLIRLCAAAGVEPEVAADSTAAMGSWSRASLVLVGGELTESVAESVRVGRLARRPDVFVVSTDLDDAEIWRRAVAIGVEHVAFLPDAEGWLLDRLGVRADEAIHGAGTALAVIGGRGGAGASTLAASLAVSAVQRGWSALLLDTDPLSGGIAPVVGAQDSWTSWSALEGVVGRVSPQALGRSLTSLGQLTVLSWARHESVEIAPPTMAAVLAAGCRFADLVVVDLPRRVDSASRVALSRATTTLLVVPAEIRACAAAARVSEQLQPDSGDVRVIVRGPGPTRLPPGAVSDALDLPLGGYLRSELAVVQALERGEPPGRHKGAMSKLTARLLDELVPGGPGRRGAAE